MKASEQINELAAALAKAQATIPAVPKRGKSHTGKYATLDDLIATIRGPLASNGLSFVQLPAKSRDGIGLVTRLMHESGQWIEEMFVMPVPGGRMNEAQAYGSGLTYARRYSLSALVGTVTEEDTDANVKPTQTQPEPARQAPPPPQYGGKSRHTSDLEKAKQQAKAEAAKKQQQQPASNGQPKAEPAKQVTIPMLKDLHILGHEVAGDKWESVVADYHAKFETQPDADGKLSTKSWTWPQYWEVFKALEKKAEKAAEEAT